MAIIIKGPAGGAPPTAEGLDIKQVISGSTADVAISELSRKGFKQVKVLNQNTITKLITEAVDRVIAAKAQKVGAEERARVIKESHSQFEALAKERIQRERNRIAELERANEALLQETEELRQQLQERDAELKKLQAGGGGGGAASDKLLAAILDRLQAGGGAGDISALEKSMERIAEKLDRLPAGGGAGAQYVDKEVVLDALFRDDGSTAADSNIAQVKVKEEKAGGVKSTLAKLKAMQKGGS